MRMRLAVLTALAVGLLVGYVAGTRTTSQTTRTAEDQERVWTIDREALRASGIDRTEGPVTVTCIVECRGTRTVSVRTYQPLQPIATVQGPPDTPMASCGS